MTTSRVLERLRTDEESPAWQREAAIDFARARGDHLAVLASRAVFAVRRGRYDEALVIKEAIQRHAGGRRAPEWNPTVAMLVYLLDRREEAQELIDGYIRWPARTSPLTPGEQALLAHDRADAPAAAQFWRQACEALGDAAEPTDDVEVLLWRRAHAQLEEPLEEPLDGLPPTRPGDFAVKYERLDKAAGYRSGMNLTAGHTSAWLTSSAILSGDPDAPDPAPTASWRGPANVAGRHRTRCRIRIL